MLSSSSVIVGSLVLTSLVMGALGAHELDCSAVSPSKLADYKTNCQADIMKDSHLSALVRLDMVESCACQLLRHTFVWESLLNHEVETLYQVSKQLVEETKEDKDKKESVSPTDPMYQDDLNGRKYFWDKFALILEGAKNQNDRKELRESILKRFSDTYYQPDLYEMPFKKAGKKVKLIQTISNNCIALQTGFQPFRAFFEDLVEFSGNSRIEFRLASYDDNLYKIFTVANMCEFLAKADQSG